MQTLTASREEILAEITEHELRIIELRKQLPSPIKTLFRFRCKPEQYVFVYASSREIAEHRLKARMDGTYGENWKIESKVVDVFNSPEHAAANSSGNLFRCLTDAEARELLADWKENQIGREPKSKQQHQSQFERDAEYFDLKLRHNVA